VSYDRIKHVSKNILISTYRFTKADIEALGEPIIGVHLEKDLILFDREHVERTMSTNHIVQLERKNKVAEGFRMAAAVVIYALSVEIREANKCKIPDDADYIWVKYHILNYSSLLVEIEGRPNADIAYMILDRRANDKANDILNTALTKGDKP